MKPEYSLTHACVSAVTSVAVSVIETSFLEEDVWHWTLTIRTGCLTDRGHKALIHYLIYTAIHIYQTIYSKEKIFTVRKKYFGSFLDAQRVSVASWLTTNIFYRNWSNYLVQVWKELLNSFLSYCARDLIKQQILWNMHLESLQRSTASNK